MQIGESVSVHYLGDACYWGCVNRGSISFWTVDLLQKSCVKSITYLTKLVTKGNPLFLNKNLLREDSK